MINRFLAFTLLILSMNGAIAQTDSLDTKKKRLDFAMNYFEVGGTFFPSFNGKTMVGDELVGFENSAAVMQYLNWGALHFWGHGEFYVTFPLSYLPFEENETTNSEFYHSVVTGGRYYPWVYRENKIIPFVGLNWSAVDFRQVTGVKSEQPLISKDFMLAADAGILYGYKDFALRLGVNFYPDSQWDYPVSRTKKVKIDTPDLAFQLGLLYTMDLTKNTDSENIDAWNKFPQVSKQSLGHKTFADFFVAAGPSLSFSLKALDFNRTEHPYLDERLSSGNFFDFAIGGQFHTLGLFSAISFRNPTFTTEGFDTTQEIRKTSFAFEVNKYLTDYSGFAPFVGLNMAYDAHKYSEERDGVTTETLTDKVIEPGITVGWDIQPGKTQDALILRTNLRWYPLSKVGIGEKSYAFSQLEYNLIQVVFYPGRLKKKAKA